MATRSRYLNNDISVLDGRAFYGFRRAKDTALRANDRYHTVAAGDELPTLAWRLLGAADLWWVLAEFNELLSPFDALVPGTKLRYPDKGRLMLEVLR